MIEKKRTQQERCSNKNGPQNNKGDDDNDMSVQTFTNRCFSQAKSRTDLYTRSCMQPFAKN